MAYYRKITNGAGVRFEATVRLSGFSPVTKRFPKLAEAKVWAAEVERSLRQGQTIAALVSGGVTVSELAVRFKSERIEDHYTEDTARKVRAAVDAFVAAHGDRRVVDVKRGHVIDWRKSLLRTKAVRRGQDPKNADTRTPATVNRLVAYASAMFTFAVDHGLIDAAAHPFRGVQRLTENNNVERFLSDAERRALLDAARPHEGLYAAIVVALVTGARQAELLNLRARDVDVERKLIAINSTKTGIGRRALPVDGEALRVLAARIEGRDADELLWPSHRSKRKPVSLRKPFEDALVKAGIEDFRWHDLRHSAASSLVAAGVPIYSVSKLLGHKSIQTTTRYSHLSDDSLRAAVAVASRVVGEAVAEAS